jgi:hypothetical protein
MNNCFRPWVLLLLAGLTSCTNLKVVRDYAKESAAFAARTDLADRYRDTYHREQPYLDPVDDLAEQATDAKRQASYPGLVRIQASVVAYMSTLAKLAGEELNTPVFNLDQVEHGLAPGANLGLHVDQLEAVAALTNLVARGLTSTLQKRAIHDLVTRADPHVQKLAADMKSLVHQYRETNHAERAKVLNVLKVHIPFTRDPGPGTPAAASTLLVNRLARAHLQAKLEEYDRIDPSYAQAEQGWAALAERHRKLKDGLTTLSAKELVEALRPTAQDLKAVSKGLHQPHPL